MGDTAMRIRAGPPGSGVRPDEDAARRIERWGLVAGVTGCTANGLLLALYAVALPGNHAFDWTGPANDAVGAVSVLAMIPLARGVCDLLDAPGHLPLLTRSLAVGGVAGAGASGLLLLGMVDLRVQMAAFVPWFIATSAWQRSAGRWAARTGRLPRRLARASEVIGTTALVGAALAGAGALLPRRSVAQFAVGGLGAVAAAGAFVALPIWQVLLSRAMSRRPLPAHTGTVADLRGLTVLPPPPG